MPISRPLLALLAGLLLGITPLQAQGAAYRPLQHEIGLQLGSAHFEPAFAGNYVNLPLALTPLNGLRYKYSLNMSDRLRAGLRYEQARYQADPDALNLFRPGLRQDVMGQMGYERTWYQGIQRFFAGADLLISRGQIRDTGIPLAPPDRYVDRYAFTGIGLGAVAGYSLSLGPRLLLTLEAMAAYQRLGYDNTRDIPASGLPDYVRPAQRLSLDVSVYLSLQTGARASKKCTCPGI